MTIQKTYFNASVSNTPILVTDVGTVLELLEASNVNNTDAYIQLFDVDDTSDITLGTTTPKQSYLIAKGDGTDRGALGAELANGLAFYTGLVIAVTTTPTGSTAPSSAVTVNIGYQ